MMTVRWFAAQLGVGTIFGCPPNDDDDRHSSLPSFVCRDAGATRQRDDAGTYRRSKCSPALPEQYLAE